MKKSSSYLDLIENFSWKSATTSLEFSKFSIEYHVESDEYLFQLTLYCSFLFRSTRLEFRTSFNSNFSSWSITIEKDEFAIWSDNESFEIFLNRDVWKMSCIVIEEENSNWQLASSIFLTLYESIIFQFSFLKNRVVLIFLVDSHTKSSSL
jgi:sucrose-6-phosphate hydrolase SacC (GH32 family)